MPGPLAGIRVVDVSAVISGPLAAQMLGDQGADVIKIEPPGYGDLLRLGPFQRGGLTTFFLNANRGKRAMILDLTQPEGCEIALRLVREADVFIENWRPGAAERLGLGPETLLAENPELIYCSVNGYGSSGPYSDRRVYDPIIQALSGHVAVQLNPEVPIRDLVRNIVSDKSSAYTAAQAITAALFARERGAGGQRIEVPMLDASLAFFWPDGMMRHTFAGEGEVAVPGPTLYEAYRLTETADGHIMYFAASDQEFEALYRALDHPEWFEDPRFDSIASRRERDNALALGALLEAEFRSRTTADLIERLSPDVPAAPVLSLEEIFDDPQIRHNEAIYEIEHPTAGTIRGARPAARFDKTPQEEPGLPPLYGEHTDEILADLGFDDAARKTLREKGIAR